MPFFLLLLLTVVCLQAEWPAPPSFLGTWGSGICTWGGIALLLVLAELKTRRLCGELGQGGPDHIYVLRRLSQIRRRFFFALLIFYAIALYGLGWGWLGRHLLGPVDRPIPGRELIILAPMFAALFLSWSRSYAIERLAHEHEGDENTAFISRWAYVALQARQNLLLVLPPLVLLLVEESVLGVFPELQDNSYFTAGLAIFLITVVFAGIPLLLRVLLALKPLAAGPLRQRLTELAGRLHFRCNDILVWNTRNTIANAMVTGPFPWLRYVVLTDRLLHGLEPDEIEAVFGHEVGHVKHHHMAFYFAFVMTSLVVLGVMRELCWEVVAALNLPLSAAVIDWLQSLQFLAPLALVGVLAAYMFVIFGYLSRRCERQADIYGCRAVNCQTFVNALEKVAVLNGIDRERPGWLSAWQHSTIARRVNFLLQVRADPGLERRFQRRLALLKWGIALLLVAVLSGALPLVSAEQVLAILK